MHSHACIHCKTPMDFIDFNRSPYCPQPNCQRALAQVVTAEKKRLQDEKYEKIVRQYQKSSKDLAQIPTNEPLSAELLESIRQNSPVVALLPINKNTLSELPEERKEAFLAHLSALFNDIKTPGEMKLKIYNTELESPMPDDESALLSNACATCKGYCCGLGATHAFQDYPSLQLYLSSQPADLQEEDLKQAYRSYMPTQSYQNACVFQGELGCTLPKEMRSFTCNNFRCSSLINYRQKVAKSDSKLTYALAVDHEKVIGTSVFNVKHFARHK